MIFAAPPEIIEPEIIEILLLSYLYIYLPAIIYHNNASLKACIAAFRMRSSTFLCQESWPSKSNLLGTDGKL